MGSPNKAQPACTRTWGQKAKGLRLLLSKSHHEAGTRLATCLAGRGPEWVPSTQAKAKHGHELAIPTLGRRQETPWSSLPTQPSLILRPQAVTHTASKYKGMTPEEWRPRSPSSPHTYVCGQTHSAHAHICTCTHTVHTDTRTCMHEHTRAHTRTHAQVCAHTRAHSCNHQLLKGMRTSHVTNVGSSQHHSPRAWHMKTTPQSPLLLHKARPSIKNPNEFSQGSGVPDRKPAGQGSLLATQNFTSMSLHS